MSRKKRSTATPVNFLLTCSEKVLGDFELKKLADVAQTRNELHEVLDRLLEEMAQASLVRWFRSQDREEIKRAANNPDDVIAIARAQIRDGQRSEEEELIPRSLLPPGSAHLAAAVRYQQRNIEKGLCSECPQPLARHSTRYCDLHLSLARGRYKPKGGKGGPPGSREYLYEGKFESGHGKQPGSLAVLAATRERQRRSTEREKLLYSRVAEQLGKSPTYVREVALARRHSKAISAALEAEAERMAPGTLALLAREGQAKKKKTE